MAVSRLACTHRVQRLKTALAFAVVPAPRFVRAARCDFSLPRSSFFSFSPSAPGTNNVPVVDAVRIDKATVSGSIRLNWRSSVTAGVQESGATTIGTPLASTLTLSSQRETGTGSAGKKTTSKDLTGPVPALRLSSWLDRWRQRLHPIKALLLLPWVDVSA